MRTLQVNRIDIDYKKFVKRKALDTDYSTLVKDDVRMMDGNKLVGVYFKLPKYPYKLVQTLKKIRYERDFRTKGLATNSRIFGYRPREKIRKDFCSSTALVREDRQSHAIITEFGKELARYYEQYCPEVFDVHKKIAKEKILPEWKIPDTPFTSGIINKNNALKYHNDSGNFPNVYSNMVGFKHKIKGGHLSIPEYDIGLEIADQTVLLFDGQKILHGVTPIIYTATSSYRYSIVYYTLKQMWNCEPLDNELARIKVSKTAKEVKRYQRLTGEIPNVIPGWKDQ